MERRWLRFQGSRIFSPGTRDRRQAAHFDDGVEHGIAAAAANGLTHATKTQRAIAERIVQEVIRTGVSRDDAVRAAVLAVWGLTGRQHLRMTDPG